MKEDRRLVFAFVVMCIMGLAFWVLGIIKGDFEGMMRDIGVEVLGAIVTAGGLLGLERIYARPDPQIETLTEQIQQQTSRLEALQAQLQTLLSQHSPEPEATDDDTDED
jgi:hypothetical protein